MPRTKQISDEDLLRKARELFIELGPHVSAQVIADRIGVSQPSLFKRFGTKQELMLRALAPPENLPVVDMIQAGPTAESLGDQIGEMIERIDGMLATVLPQIEVIKASRLPKEVVWGRYSTPPPVRLIRAITGFFEKLKAEDRVRKDYDSRYGAQLIFGALVGQYMLEADGTADEKARLRECLRETICTSIQARAVADR